MVQYFAYGSNMLRERLQRRCPSASLLGPAILPGYGVTFTKIGRDGSGKATLTPGSIGRDPAHPGAYGVVFSLCPDDMTALDRIEGRGQGYQRLERVGVLLGGGPASCDVTTYIAEPDHIDLALQPFDWYLSLVLAGAVENLLPPEYCDWLSAHARLTDTHETRPTRLEALSILHALAT